MVVQQRPGTILDEDEALGCSASSFRVSSFHTITACLSVVAQLSCRAGRVGEVSDLLSCAGSCGRLTGGVAVEDRQPLLSGLF